MTAEGALLRVRYEPVLSPRVAGTRAATMLRYLADGARGRGPETPAEMRRLLAGRGLEFSPRSALFSAAGGLTAAEAAEIPGYVRESVRDMRPLWSRDAGGKLVDARRAFYGFVVALEWPERLDLRRLTRAAMAELEADVGSALPRWAGAVHRNTRHPHVHVLLPARRQTEPEVFRGLLVTKVRLARMRLALQTDLLEQRRERSLSRLQGRGEFVPDALRRWARDSERQPARGRERER